jgi:hypothetical protein
LTKFRPAQCALPKFNGVPEKKSAHRRLPIQVPRAWVTSMEFKNYLFYPGSVVKYKGQFYLLWNVNKFGKAQLIDKNGIKFSGTPMTNRLQWVNQCPVINYANRKFIVDRNNRIFSTATGNQVYKTNCPERKKILTALNDSPLLESKENFYKGFMSLLEFNRCIYDFKIPAIA